MTRQNLHLQFIVRSALLAALYTVLTLVFWEFSAFGIQFRVSEALCVLAVWTPCAIPGATIGCFTANLLAGHLIDALFGALATFLGTFLTYEFRKHLTGHRWLCPLPNALINAIAVPLILYFGYGLKELFGFSGPWTVLGLTALSVFIGECAVMYLLGLPLLRVVSRYFSSPS